MLAMGQGYLEFQPIKMPQPLDVRSVLFWNIVPLAKPFRGV